MNRKLIITYIAVLAVTQCKGENMLCGNWEGNVQLQKETGEIPGITIVNGTSIVDPDLGINSMCREAVWLGARPSGFAQITEADTSHPERLITWFEHGLMQFFTTKGTFDLPYKVPVVYFNNFLPKAPEFVPCRSGCPSTGYNITNALPPVANLVTAVFNTLSISSHISISEEADINADTCSVIVGAADANTRMSDGIREIPPVFTWRDPVNQFAVALFTVPGAGYTLIKTPTDWKMYSYWFCGVAGGGNRPVFQSHSPTIGEMGLFTLNGRAPLSFPHCTCERAYQFNHNLRAVWKGNNIRPAALNVPNCGTTMVDPGCTYDESFMPTTTYTGSDACQTPCKWNNRDPLPNVQTTQAPKPESQPTTTEAPTSNTVPAVTTSSTGKPIQTTTRGTSHKNTENTQPQNPQNAQITTENPRVATASTRQSRSPNEPGTGGGGANNSSGRETTQQSPDPVFGNDSTTNKPTCDPENNGTSKDPECPEKSINEGNTIWGMDESRFIMLMVGVGGAALAVLLFILNIAVSRMC